MTTDSRTLSGRRSDAAQVVGLRSPSEGARMEVRLVHAAALERASPCVERGHPAGAGHPSRGELIRLIAYLWLATLYGDLPQCVSFGRPIDPCPLNSKMASFFEISFSLFYDISQIKNAIKRFAWILQWT